MDSLQTNLIEIRRRIERAAQSAGRDPCDIRLIAVSKAASVDAIQTLIAAGHCDFGENRLPAGLKKLQAVEAEVRWHMIGRIQTNKIKYLPQFSLIHSLDRWPLAVALNEYALKKDLRFRCLVQVNIARDPNKAGILPGELPDFITSLSELNNLEIQGLMTIPALEADSQQTRSWYANLANQFAETGAGKLPGNVKMRWLSMGMSDDFELAVAAGANMVRVGSAIFSN
ncbi:MAG: YggS family pyridoxal phosphate-dependent enzyme [Firmicutes bacterium]|nr:YggS family pyridoxal phosphate-dependent enzyme [Bacillota bacterium]